MLMDSRSPISGRKQFAGCFRYATKLLTEAAAVIAHLRMRMVCGIQSRPQELGYSSVKLFAAQKIGILTHHNAPVALDHSKSPPGKASEWLTADSILLF